MSEEPLITLAYILDNPPREITVRTEKGVRRIKVRDPTTQDRIDAIMQARKDPRWKDMTQEDRNGLIMDFIALKMIVEPKLTVENYYKANSLKLANVLSAVVADYTNRLQRLAQQRAKEIQDFLGQKKASNQ